MDGQDAELGDEGTVGGRITKPIVLMRRMFSGASVDRKLVRGVVEAFAKIKGMDHEAAHKLLHARAEKIGFGAPDIIPDSLLKPEQIVTRTKLRVAKARNRLKEEGFRSNTPNDDKGESPDPDTEARDRSMRGDAR